jgi:hypothetical protein
MFLRKVSWLQTTPRYIPEDGTVRNNTATIVSLKLRDLSLRHHYKVIRLYIQYTLRTEINIPEMLNTQDFRHISYLRYDLPAKLF